MSKQEKSFVKKLFQTKKARLLYFIYRRRKIKNDSGVKAKLKRAFNYKSDGHLYHDLDLLKNSGLIEEKNGYLTISKSGRAEFQLLEILRLTTLLSVGYGGYLLFYTIMMYNGLPNNFQIPLYSVSVVLFTIAILCFYTFKTFRPLPPDPSEEIE